MGGSHVQTGEGKTKREGGSKTKEREEKGRKRGTGKGGSTLFGCVIKKQFVVRREKSRVWGVQRRGKKMECDDCGGLV